MTQNTLVLLTDFLGGLFIIASFLFCVELSYLLDQEKQEKQIKEAQLKERGDLLKIMYNLPDAAKSSPQSNQLDP